jgi:pyruvate formate lyase activating enzyme
MNCEVCFRHCLLIEGQSGFCHARGLIDGKNVCLNYGLATSLALDPIEKKPLKEFFPGSFILSYGSYGCNLRCPFCQNYEISQFDLKAQSEYFSPERLVKTALDLKSDGNIGVAFTYNEPLISYEYVYDVSVLAHKEGLKTVLVTNGTASLEVLQKILPYIDAMNIDLKGFSEDFFRYIGGDFQMVKDFIALAQKSCHVELTTLVIPGHNDSADDMEAEAKWIASLDRKIPLHITRYFPRYKEKEPATSLEDLSKLQTIAKKFLTSVYVGNI